MNISEEVLALLRPSLFGERDRLIATFAYAFAGAEPGSAIPMPPWMTAADLPALNRILQAAERQRYQLQADGIY